MSGEEVFDHGEIELRVHEDGAKICLEHIWETLESYTRQLGEFHAMHLVETTFGESLVASQ